MGYYLAILPLIINLILNVFVLIMTRKREIQFDKNGTEEAKQRKLKTWASANLHFVCVFLYALIVFVSLVKKRKKIARIRFSCEYGYLLNAVTHMGVGVILGVIIPGLCLWRSPPMRDGVIKLWG